MTRRTAIQPDLFAAEEHRAKLDRLGDPLQEMDSVIDFAALAAEVEKVFPPKDQSKGGRPPYPIETMVRIVVLKRLYGLSDEQMEFQLLDRMSFKRFCGLEHSRTVPDRTTIWLFENRIGPAGAQALFADPAQGQAPPATAQAAESAQHAHCPRACAGRARVRCHRSHGRQDDPHHWTGQSRLCPHPDGCLLQHPAHGVAREVQRHPLVRPAHGRSVPKAAGGRKKPGHEAATSGQNGGKSSGIQCRMS